MDSHLATIDVLLVVLYFAGTLALGAWFARRQRGLRTYFAGDRNVSWWLVLVSIVATETSTVTFLSVPGVAYNPRGGNLTFLQLAFGYVVGRLLIAWLLLPLYFKGELISAYQVLRERFDVRVQRTASALFLLTRAIADGLRLYLAALLLGQFTGWDSKASVVVIGCATIFYTYLGGVQAVIWTDLIQFAVYIAGAVLAAFCMLGQLPGGLAEFRTVGEAAGKFTLLNLSTDPTQAYTLWAGLIGGAFFSMASHGADQMMVQRYFCSRSLGQARLALVLSGLVVLVQFLLFLLLGVGVYVLADRGLVSGLAGHRNDEVLGLYIVNYLPHGLVGLVIASVLAASMSTLSSSLNSSAGAFIADFYQPLRPGRSEGQYLLVSRLMTAVWGAARILVALAALTLLAERSVVDQVLSVAGFTTGMVLGLFLLGRMRRPVRSSAALTGLVAGFAAVSAAWLPSVGGHVLLAWPWFAPLGAVTTVVVALLVEVLRRAARPSGNGGPQPGLDEPR
jgi:SSS family transporter